MKEGITLEKRQWTPKISADIPEDLFLKYQELIPHGSKKALVRRLIEDLVAIVSCGGNLAIGAILDGRLGIGYNHLESLIYDPRRAKEITELSVSERTPGEDSGIKALKKILSREDREKGEETL